MSKRALSPSPSTSEPPTKRQSTSGPKRSLNFDFPDGNIELIVGGERIYRIHKSVLARASTVFQDMMEIARDPQVDTGDALVAPEVLGKAKMVGEDEVLDLKDDEVVEWELVLSLLYNGSKFLPSSLRLHQLRSLLHLAAKYSFDDLFTIACTLVLDRFKSEERYIRHRKRPFGEASERGVDSDPSHPARSLELLVGIICLAREFDLGGKKDGIVGRAFYCIVLRYSPDFEGLMKVVGGKRTNGWKTGLDATDLYTLLRLQTFLLSEQSHLLAEKSLPEPFKTHHLCNGNATCEEAVLKDWSDQFEDFYNVSDDDDRWLATGAGRGTGRTNVYIRNWLEMIAGWDHWGQEHSERACSEAMVAYWGERKYDFEKTLNSICGIVIESWWKPSAA